MNRRWMVYILISCILLLTACGGGAGSSQPTGGNTGGSSQDSTPEAANKSSNEPIKIGVVTSLSGPYGEVGKEMLDAVKTAIKEVNEKGGLLGGKEVILVAEDDETKPDVAIRKAEKMVMEQNINLFLGAFASSVTLALSGNMPNWDSLLIGTISKSMKLTTSEKNDHFFRLNHNDKQDVLTMEDWMINGKLPYKKFYLVAADYEWGHDLAKEMEEIVRKMGGQILGKEFTPLGTPDYSTVLTNARSKKPDVIMAAYAGADGVNFASQVHSFGIINDGIDVIITPMQDSIANNNPDLVNSVFGPVNYHHSLDFEKNKEFVKRFEAEHGYKPTNFSGESYIGAWMLFEAIEKTGSTDVKNIIQTLKNNFTFYSAMGELHVDPESHQVIHPNFIGELMKDPETGKSAIKIIHTTPSEVANP